MKKKNIKGEKRLEKCQHFTEEEKEKKCQYYQKHINQPPDLIFLKSLGQSGLFQR